MQELAHSKCCMPGGPAGAGQLVQPHWLCVFGGCILTVLKLWTAAPPQSQASYITAYTRRCAHIARSFTYGRSRTGIPLLALELTGPGLQGAREARPAFRYVANLHGDEPSGRSVQHPGVGGLVRLGAPHGSTGHRRANASCCGAHAHPPPAQDANPGLHARYRPGCAACRHLLLLLAEHLCLQYQRQPQATRLLDSMRLLLVPAANPDGFERKQRGNALGIDLNRCVAPMPSHPAPPPIHTPCGSPRPRPFPMAPGLPALPPPLPWFGVVPAPPPNNCHTRRHPIGCPRPPRDFPDAVDPEALLRGDADAGGSNGGGSRQQPETRALMGLVASLPCVAAASLHEGAIVASYPMDGYADGSMVRLCKRPPANAPTHCHPLPARPPRTHVSLLHPSAPQPIYEAPPLFPGAPRTPARRLNKLCVLWPPCPQHWPTHGQTCTSPQMPRCPAPNGRCVLHPKSGSQRARPRTLPLPPLACT